MIDAKTTLKNLMTTFIDRLSEMTDSTGVYHSKMEGYSIKIGQTDNLAELSSILDDIMQDTRIIQASSMRSHEELISTRKQAHIAEERVKQLEQELEQVSELVREDQLTGALNRRGLDEVLDREIKRADRQQTPISIALLDVDNFKQLNDSFGHQTGDQALMHLIQVIKKALRPTDEVARYGGEEFLIILIDTSLEEAMLTITRLQRELTKNLFLHDNKRQLITFSAGVALHSVGEDPELTINRADSAMYKAKRAGKNRVFAAD
jgi:diguanylate cyclase